ncbi:hypothetical protein B296_00014003 [Ensete ventricosum]|uniref:Uncharacterized protein n=1 Tax=Ensete ventricosum TaxID=4639 RepID=A0A426ZTY4_ENSVE|nr:hypothetical protein B296_00014003 [Ensete ventricosum]
MLVSEVETRGRKKDGLEGGGHEEKRGREEEGITVAREEEEEETRGRSKEGQKSGDHGEGRGREEKIKGGDNPAMTPDRVGQTEIHKGIRIQTSEKAGADRRLRVGGKEATGRRLVIGERGRPVGWFFRAKEESSDSEERE